MAINNFISTRQVINHFIEEEQLDHNLYMPMFKRLAKKAYKEINGGGVAYKKRIEVLTFDQCCVELPADAIAIENILWGDKGCDCDTIFNNLYQQWPGQMFMHQSVRFGGIDALGNVFCSGDQYDFEITDNVMVFKRNFDGQKITMRIQYMECDNEGFLMINELAENALHRFFEMKLSKASKWKSKEFRLSPNERNQDILNWEYAKSGARADLMQNTPAEDRAAVAMYNNPLSGHAPVYQGYDLLQ